MERTKAREFPKERAIEREPSQLQGTQWLCTDCRFVLGYVNPEKTEVRMKAKDFFLTVEGGRITHPCRRCGKVNEIVEQEFLAWKSNQNDFNEFMANRKLFEEFLKHRTNFKKFLASEKKKETRKKGEN